MPPGVALQRVEAWKNLQAFAVIYSQDSVIYSSSNLPWVFVKPLHTLAPTELGLEVICFSSLRLRSCCYTLAHHLPAMDQSVCKPGETNTERSTSTKTDCAAFGGMRDGLCTGWVATLTRL